MLGARVATKIFLLEITLSLLKYLVVLFKKPSQSFKILVNQPALDDCVYSYTDHKTFQKKLRLFSMAGFTTIITATIISTLVLNLTTGPIFQSRAATYTWAQTSWAGGATANNAVHASNQTGWTEYSSKDSSLSAVNSGADLQVSSQSNTWTVTDDGATDTGFNNSGAAMSGISVSGTGSGAGVSLVSGWTKHASNPVLNLGANGTWDDAYIEDASVILDGTTYKMWYAGQDGSNWRIGYATSPDGITWTKYASNPVVDLGTSGAWDDATVLYSSVILDGTTYKMWYSGNDGTDYRIGYATSPDGITWTKYGSNPVLNLGTNGTWDDAWVYAPSIMLDGTTYKMWYTGQDGTTWRFGYATLVSSGTFTSHVYNTTGTISFGTLSWNATTPSGTSITIKARSGNQSNLSDATAWGSCTNITSGAALSTGGCVTNGHRYIQFQATLSTTDTSATPTLSDISLTYTNYPTTAQTLTSSSYNTSSSSNIISSVSFTEDTSLPTGTTVQFQLRTAPDSSGSPGTWTSFLGPDGTTGTYFSNSGTGCSKVSATVTCSTIPSALTSGNNDQWISYKAYLTSSGLATPTLSDITLGYVANAPPQFDTSFNTTGVTAVENSDGTVTIQYQIRDPDTTTGTVTPNAVTPTFEYSTNGGSSYSSITSSYLGSTDLQNKTVGESSYTLYSATWNPKSQLGSSTYVTNAKIRVTLNDNEAANNTANASTANFTLDTTNPVPGSPALSVNPNFATAPTTATLTISATDNSSMQMKVGLTSDLSDATWETYSATKSLTLQSDPDTVYAQFKDAYNNTSSIVSATTPETPTAMMIQDTSNLKLTTPEYRLFSAWKVIQTPNPGFSRYNVLRSTDNSTFTSIATIADINTNYYGDSSVSQNQSYYYKISSQDSNNNISFFSSTIQAQADGIQNLGEGGGGADGIGPTISSVNVSNLQTTQATITWTTNEVSNSTVGFSTDTSFTTEQGVASYVTSHSVTLIGLTPNTTYKFQVKSTDSTSNQTTDNNGGLGYSFTTLDGPRITNVTTEEISNTSAKIIWYTNSDSSSFVVYSVNSNLSSSTETGSSSLVGGDGPDYYHSVTLSSLTQNTNYYFYVKSTDSENNTAINNNGLNYYTFKTTNDATSPEISNISVSVTTPDTVIITWNTNEPSTSQVQYGASTSYGSQTTTDSDLDLTHVVPITQLTPDTAYNFAVKSADASNNQSTSDNQTFTTLEESEIRADQDAPTISDISVGSITSSLAIVSFITNESCTGTVDYGTTTSYGSAMGGSGSSNTTSHTITLVGLSASTAYNFKVNCRDQSDNIGSSDNQTFTTLASTSSSDTAAPTLSNITASSITSSSAVITFATNESCLGAVHYGATTSYNQGASEVESAASHSIALRGLSSATTYYFQAKCTDASNNTGSSTGQLFTTLAPSDKAEGNKTETEKRVSTLIEENFAPEDIQNAIKKLQSPPTITGEGPQVSDVRSTSVKITWNTDKKANSLIVYSSEESRLTASDVTAEGKPEESSLTHKVTLSNLIPGTTYYFKAKSTDIYGNITTSQTKSFTTLVVPLISDVQVSNTTLASAVVTWSTSVVSTGLVEYGRDTNYGAKKEHDDPTAKGTTHTIALTNLEPTTTYHFRIKGTSATDNSLISSEDYTFSTQALPQITNESIKKITDNSTKITFTTNIDTDTTILYKPLKQEETIEYLSKGKPDLARTHEITLDSLEFGTEYDIQIKAKDAYGNEVTKQLPTFTTGIDLEPPIITLLRTENALVSGKKDKIQTIIIWKTDEPSTTQIMYQEGIDLARTELKEKTQEDKSLSKDHVVVLTDRKSVV